MYQNANDAYFESRILSADPVELVCMLYQGAMDAVRDARRHLAGGEIEARSRSINKGCEILMELLTSLDRERAGEMGTRLAALYEYLHGRLIEANIQQSDAPLAEALALLNTLSEAWSGIRGQQSENQPEPVQPDWTPMAAKENVSYGSHAWSF